MNICIIGAGNMGGAIALGTAKRFPNYKINVTNRSGKNTERFTQFPNISCY
ncbi:MAG: NAD(P)-binding domain-containing protein, partial [Muribaculaceae bacterium]|nr:NAD(P)-binding domain-containing protein [Muribaculaceae bacterium]